MWISFSSGSLMRVNKWGGLKPDLKYEGLIVTFKSWGGKARLDVKYRGARVSYPNFYHIPEVSNIYPNCTLAGIVLSYI